jgi:hypothetical protein
MSSLALLFFLSPADHNAGRLNWIIGEVGFFASAFFDACVDVDAARANTL